MARRNNAAWMVGSDAKKHRRRKSGGETCQRALAIESRHERSGSNKAECQDQPDTNIDPEQRARKVMGYFLALQERVDKPIHRPVRK